jgi:hypothetical protein
LNHCLGISSPVGALGLDRSVAGFRKRIDFALAAGDGLPPGSHQPLPFQAMKDWIQRPFGKIEDAVAAKAQRIEDGVAMRRCMPEHGQDQCIQADAMARIRFGGCHT